MKDVMQALEDEIQKNYTEEVLAENLHKEKLKLGFYESNFKHFKRQRKILIIKFLNSHDEAEKSVIKKELSFNQSNMEKTLAILATVKQK